MLSLMVVLLCLVLLLPYINKRSYDLTLVEVLSVDPYEYRIHD